MVVWLVVMAIGALGALAHAIAVSIGLAEVARRDPPPPPHELRVTPEMGSLDIMAANRAAQAPVQAWRDSYLPIARRIGWGRMLAPVRAAGRVSARFAPFRFSVRVAKKWAVAARRALFPTDAEDLARRGWRHHQRQAQAARRAAQAAEQAGRLEEARNALARAQAAEHQARAVAGAAPQWAPALRDLRALSATPNGMLSAAQINYQGSLEKALEDQFGINTSHLRARYQPAAGPAARILRAALGLARLTPQGRVVSVAMRVLRVAPWFGMFAAVALWQGARVDKVQLKTRVAAVEGQNAQLRADVQAQAEAIARVQQERDSALAAREVEHARWAQDQVAASARRQVEADRRVAARQVVRRVQDVGQGQSREAESANGGGDGGDALLGQLRALRAADRADPGAVPGVPPEATDRPAAGVPGRASP